MWSRNIHYEDVDAQTDGINNDQEKDQQNEFSMCKWPLTPSDVINFIWDALPDLVPFVYFEKREKQSWRSVTFSKVGDFNLQLY